MITGDPPWVDNKNYLSTIYKILHSNKPPEFPKNISENLNSFLGYCFKMKPFERLNVTKLLKHPFIVGGNLSQFESDLKSQLNTSIKSSYELIQSDNLKDLSTKYKNESKNNIKIDKLEKLEKLDKNQSTSVLNLGDVNTCTMRRESDDSMLNSQIHELNRLEKCENKKENIFMNDEIIINSLNKDGKEVKVKVSIKELFQDNLDIEESNNTEVIKELEKKEED